MENNLEIQEIKKMVKDQNDIYLREIQLALQKQIGVNVSISNLTLITLMLTITGLTLFGKCSRGTYGVFAIARHYH